MGIGLDVDVAPVPAAAAEALERATGPDAFAAASIAAAAEDEPSATEPRCTQRWLKYAMSARLTVP